MYVTNMCGTGDRDLSEEEILTVIKEFNEEDGGEMGQADVTVNDNVVVISFTHYYCNDGNCVWIMVRCDCTDEFIAKLLAESKKVE